MEKNDAHAQACQTNDTADKMQGMENGCRHDKMEDRDARI
jgi:hypothetical protein